MKKLILYIVVFLILFGGIYAALNYMFFGNHPYRQWDVQSIDTMKYSRDRARETLKGVLTEKEIAQQVEDIAKTGATHVAIGTPYDEEFTPVMKLWVEAARKHNLNVWFRGNFSGWEGWFEYKEIDKPTHIAKTKAFIENNPDLFEDGDIFTSCTECENGHKVEYGNPQDIAAHRDFLLEEYEITKQAFAKINKDVRSNFYSMNGDLALAMMDSETTLAFDGIVVIDHYVKEPEQLANDIRTLAKQSGGTIILGEYGAPIPDIHGVMTDEEQMLWVKESLHAVSQIPEVGGVNYWTNKDSSTAIWDKNGKAKWAVGILMQYFKGKVHVIKYSN